MGLPLRPVVCVLGLLITYGFEPTWHWYGIAALTALVMPAQCCMQGRDSFHDPENRMTRELLSVRHGLAVVGGAAVIWLVDAAALPLLGQVPSYPARIAEWQGMRPQMSAVLWALLFLVVAAILSVTEEVRRVGGLRTAFKMAVGCALIAYIARAWSTPSHLQGVVATVAAARGIGMVAAVAIMHVAKRRWLSHGNPVEPGLG